MNNGIPKLIGKTKAQNQEKPESWYLLTMTLNDGRNRKRLVHVLSKRLKPTSITIKKSIVNVVTNTVQTNRVNHQYSDREALPFQFM
jgi:hypothetical protein